MSYQSYLPDPSLWKFSKDLTKLCSSGEITKPYLTVIDGEAQIICGSETLTKFALDGKYPVDSFDNINRTILPGNSIKLFDNGLFALAPSTMLSADKQYARAILLSIKYPDLNDLGISILQGDKNALITITDKAGLSNPMYVNTFYSYLANPLTIGPTQIQDTFTVENVSSNYAINIRALVIYVKTTTSPNDHTC